LPQSRSIPDLARPRFASPFRVSSIGSNVALIVADLGLKEVESVIGAMRAADQQSSRGGPMTPEKQFLPRQVIQPEPRYEPRQVIHPSPLYAPRPVIHRTPRIEARTLDCIDCPPKLVVHKVDEEMPMQPPWKTVPWENKLQPSPKVKLAPPHPDIIHKGTVMDIFI
jgi:hypothetical protein